MVDRGRELVLLDQVEDGDRPLLLRLRRLAQGGGVFQIDADDAPGGPGIPPCAQIAPAAARNRSIQPPISSG